MRGAIFFNMTCYEELLKRISPKLKGITHRLNGCFTYFNAEDLYQEALLHLWQDFRAGKLADKTDSYILQGCYFHLKNYLRKVKNKINLVSIETIVNEEGLNLEEMLSSENPENCFDHLENRILVRDMQDNGLTKREKEVLSLCLEGLTIREIGKRLGVSHVRIVKLKERIKRKSNYLLDRRF